MMDPFTCCILVTYVMAGVYVSIRYLDEKTVEDHGMYSIVATMLALIWPLLVMYILYGYCKNKMKK